MRAQLDRYILAHFVIPLDVGGVTDKGGAHKGVLRQGGSQTRGTQTRGDADKGEEAGLFNDT